MNFIDGKEDHGILIDWNEVFKRFKKLKCPKEYFDPTTAPIGSAKYFMYMSERSVGKTTMWLLLGMILFDMYGIVTQYIRQYEEMTAPSVANEIFRTILQYNEGRYIKEITHGKYNSIYIFWKKAYFCNVDENGKIIEKDTKNFLQFLSIDKNFDYKSSYTAPSGDLILFDEFIGKHYPLNEFIDFEDLLKTIIKQRKSPIVVMLANTIDRNHTYFREFEISKEVKKLKKGQHDIITTEKGTKVYVELVEPKQTELKKEVNRLFFGFQNPKLAAITGGELAWAFDPVPHITHDESEHTITKILKVDTGDELLTMELMQSNERGLFVNVYPSTRTYEDSIILTIGEIRDQNHVFGYGSGNIYKLIWGLYKDNKFYYADNETGSLIKNYIKNVKKLQLERT